VRNSDRNGKFRCDAAAAAKRSADRRVYSGHGTAAARQQMKQTEEIQIEEIQTEEIQTEEIQTEEIQTEEIQSGLCAGLNIEEDL